MSGQSNGNYVRKQVLMSPETRRSVLEGENGSSDEDYTPPARKKRGSHRSSRSEAVRNYCIELPDS